MFNRKHWISALALLLAGSILYTPVGAQSTNRQLERTKEAKTKLATIADTAQVKVGLRVASMPLVTFHALSQSPALPSVSTTIEFPNASTPRERGFAATSMSGAWYEHDAGHWPRAVCKMRMWFMDFPSRDFPESALTVRSANLIGTAAAVRTLIDSSDARIEPTSVELLSEEAFLAESSSAQAVRFPAIHFVAENYSLPSGCEAHVRRVKGWIGNSIVSFKIPPREATKSILTELAKDMPQQPIELALSLNDGAQIQDIAVLAERYSIATLRMSLMFNLPPKSPYFTTQSFEFGSFGPPIRVQIERIACLIRTYKNRELYTGLDGTSIRFRVTPSLMTVNAVITVKEAKRLVDELPPPVSAATITEFMYPEAFEQWKSIFIKNVSEPIKTQQVDEIPAGCERFFNSR